jgi:hypothetical protein
MQKIALIVFLFVVACKKNTNTTDAVAAKDIVLKKMIDAYTEVQYGNMPLIISVPHGGTVQPTTIPDRTCAGITTVTDSKTIELVYAIDSVLKADYGVQPYMVLTNLARIKIDQNRDFAEATCSNNNLSIFWNNYHYSIDTAITKILVKYPSALFIDLHGHGHTKQRLELGYLIGANALRNPTSINYTTSSLKNQISQYPPAQNNSLLFGTKAFGTMMGNRSFPSVPSQQDAAPLVTDTYFDGGYNTATYCAYSKVFGWQIESNFTGVRDNPTSRVIFAKAFAQSIMEYYTTNTTMQPSSFGK